MKANKQAKIKINKSGYKRSRFNWSHDVNTTFNWGEIQPTQCKLLIPGSKTTMQAQNLIRLAPMVAPTFGRVKYKTFNQFVAMAEVFPNFDAMMAQEPKSTASYTKTPTIMPWTSLGGLSINVLHGARATLYFANNATDAAAGKYWTQYRSGPGITPNASDPTCGDWYTAWSHVASAFTTGPVTDAFNQAANKVMPRINGMGLRLGAFGAGYAGLWSNTSDVQVVLGAQSFADFCPVHRGDVYVGTNNVLKDYQKEVTMDSADYVLEGSVEYSAGNIQYFALCVELSDFGKRIRKILQGCGYQIDFVSQAHVNILPLLAQFKAYFDVFGLQLYQGWETTYCARLIKYIENDFVGSVQAHRVGQGALATISNTNLMLAFIMIELANEWYTDAPDFIGAHTEKVAVSPSIDQSKFISVTTAGNMQYYTNVNDNAARVGDGMTTYDSQYTQSTLNPTNPTKDTAIMTSEASRAIGYINQIQHGQVDAEMLKRMYKWTNRNTLLGREIAKILRAQGLGKYVDECKSNYIGSSDVMITISDVISQAATSDAALGEYGGRGLQYESTGTLVFENDEYGYWVTLATVVPEAGYTQGIDPTLEALEKFSLYNPDFDALGVEMTDKRSVVGTNYIVSESTADQGYMGFGFVPRMSKFKVCQNLTNGDFNRHGKRSTYLPYTLDKQLNVNDYNVTAQYYDFNGLTNKIWGRVQLNKSARVENMPIAGNVWRMPTKYNWLGNFNRIFLNTGVKDDDDITNLPTDDSSMAGGDAVGINDYNDDNFMSHSIYDVKCYAPMKPIEDSYGLDDDEADHAGAEFVTKA